MVSSKSKNRCDFTGNTLLPGVIGNRVLPAPLQTARNPQKSAATVVLPTCFQPLRQQHTVSIETVLLPGEVSMVVPPPSIDLKRGTAQDPNPRLGV
jgi:hypothetical protein